MRERGGREELIEFCSMEIWFVLASINFIMPTTLINEGREDKPDQVRMLQHISQDS